MAQYSVGVDIGVNITRLGIFLLDGTMEETWEICTEYKKGCKGVLKDIVYSIDKKLESRKIDKSDVIGIGVSIPGTVNKAGIVDYCVELGWGIVNVKELFMKLCKLSVVVGNKANMAALGEKWRGASKNCANSVVLMLDKYVGCGIIANDSLILGNRGLSGEIGSMMICTIESPSGNIKCGELNEYASENGMLASYQYAMNGGRILSFSGSEGVTIKSIFEIGKTGEPLAQKVIDEFGKGIAHALWNLVLVIDPEIIVVGGEVSEEGTIVLECIQKYLEEIANRVSPKVSLTLAELGNYAAVYGSAKYIMDVLECLDNRGRNK